MRLALILVLATTGCDEAADALGLGDADMGPTNVVLTQPDETTIGALTADDRTAICQALFTSVDRKTPVATKCSVVGIGAGGTAISDGDGDPVGRCGEAAEACAGLAALGQQELPTLSFGDCGLWEGATDACTTTVGELRVCLDLMADAAVNTAVQLLTCAVLDGADSLPSLDLPAPEVPDGAEECARVRMECPGVFGADDADMVE